MTRDSVTSEAETADGQGGVPAGAARKRWWTEWVGPAVIALLVLGLHGNVLFGPGGRMFSMAGTDLQTQFVSWRTFGFGELAKGNVALWNPYSFSGLPFVGAWQSALFYPPNWLFMVMDVGRAANWGIALHLIIAGCAMYAWARRRGVSPAGATVAGVMYMFGAPYAFHVLPGHLPFLCIAAWTPLVFMVADEVIGERSQKSDDRSQKKAVTLLRWGLVGAVVVALMVLAGYPQPVYITAVVGSGYLGVNLLWRAVRGKTWESGEWKGQLGALAAWGGMWIGGALLSAIQVGPALSTAAESGRAGKAPFAFSASFPLPPENLLAAVVPGLFGDGVRSSYVGRWYVWEVIPYFGTAGLLLALTAMAAVPSRVRRFAGGMVVVLIVVAMGKHTPLFKLLYDYFPGFGRFRGTSKFIWAASPFVAMLAGLGWDAVRSGSKRAVWAAGAFVLLALVTAYAGTQVARPEEWGRFTKWVGEKIATEGLIQQWPVTAYTDATFVKDSAAFAARQCYVAAAVIGATALLLAASRYWQYAAWGVAVLAVAELGYFSRATQVTCDVHLPYPENWKKLAGTLNGDRVVCSDVGSANAGMVYGVPDIAGYDPVALRRYAQFLAASQGDPNWVDAVDVRPVQSVVRPFNMLRLKYALIRTGEPPGGQVVEIPDLPLPRVHLVGRYELIPDRVAMMGRVFSDTFNPRSTVLLEERPVIEPAGDGAGAAGWARVVGEGTDHLEIEAQVARPAILLVTDAYSAGWRARGMADSDQGAYEVLPANIVLRAVPLAAGKHHILMEYDPPEWGTGRALTLGALPVYVGLWGVSVWMGRRGRVKATRVRT